MTKLITQNRTYTDALHLLWDMQQRTPAELTICELCHNVEEVENTHNLTLTLCIECYSLTHTLTYINQFREYVEQTFSTTYDEYLKTTDDVLRKRVLSEFYMQNVQQARNFEDYEKQTK